MDLRPSLTWTSRFLLVSIRKVRRSGWTSAASCFLVDESRLSRVTCQVNWPWSWARWAVGSRRCCWQPWEKCSGYQGMSSGTGQFTVLPLKSLHDHRMIMLMSRWSFILHLLLWALIVFHQIPSWKRANVPLFLYFEYDSVFCLNNRYCSITSSHNF